jgi:5-methyltetrahydrofolate--homocysteine methyltransferase
MEAILPLVKKYGAMFILLPLSDRGIPTSIEEKRSIIHEIMAWAEHCGLSREDIVVDGLVGTVGANPRAAAEAIETIRYCRQELGVATVVGLSNISFGLPDRTAVNAAFLTMAIQEGLTMAIANPSQDSLVNAAFAADLLLGKAGAGIRYINKINSQTRPEALSQPTRGAQPTVYEDVMRGSKEQIVKHVQELLTDGRTASDLVWQMLIPAIREVGRLFEKKIYFLPQLIASAEAMKTAVEYLEPRLEGEGGRKSLPTVVIATVQGDIHDIGKNLVVLMLKNYGYRVIDLGKDVSKEVIVETAIREDAAVIGLSALMTTTMMEMKHVVAYAKECGCRAKIVIGGAVVTEGFAEEINADGYSEDAAGAVKLLEQLVHY